MSGLEGVVAPSIHNISAFLNQEILNRVQLNSFGVLYVKVNIFRIMTIQILICFTFDSILYLQSAVYSAVQSAF